MKLIAAALACALSASLVGCATTTDRMMNASALNRTPEVAALLKSGATPNVRGIRSMTPLLNASYHGNIEMAKELIARGADVDAREETGATALMTATFKGDMAMTRLLLENGASPNIRTPLGGTALSNAAIQGRADIGALLLDKKADPNFRDSTGATALHTASLHNHTEFVRLLLARGADVDAQAEEGGTALMNAALKGHMAMARLLLENGASPNLQSRLGGTALMNAAITGRADIGALLLDKKADPGLRDSRGAAALHTASFGNHTEFVRLLLARGADADVKSNEGATSLMNAANHGNVEMVQLLLEKGADPAAVAAGGGSALKNAEIKGFVEVARLLREASGVTRREEPRSPVAASPAAPASPRPSFASQRPRFASPDRLDDLAVIVGVETYSDIATKAPYAERDADAFKAYVRALGVPERNIVLLKGSKAGRASIAKNLEQWLPRMAKADSRVYFYFSGHGAPDVKTGQAYLVPWDGDPNFLESTAYPVAQLYKSLGQLPAKQVLVAMDSCFSGAGGRSVLASGARPLVGKIDAGTASAKITVLAASASNEISGSLDDKGHGAFTYFLLQGLDAGKTTPKALADYLTPRVQDEARRLNRDQTPQLQGDGSWSLR